jgi:site-specific DNA-methyltransferase (adenine-specific)
LDPLNEYSLNYYVGDTLKLDIKKEFKVKKFDLIIGNPPYSTNPSEQNTQPLYDKFILKFIDQCYYLSFIVPSRWFAGGKGLDKFRKTMMLRKEIKLIKHFDDASKVFPGTDIKGGVNYFLKDSSWNGKCDLNGSSVDLNKYDIIPKNIFLHLIEKTKDYPKISSIYMNRGYYKIETNDKRLKVQNSKNMLTCLVSLQKSSDRKKYISLEVPKEQKTWKVVTSRAAHGSHSGFGYINTSSPNEIYTNSYIGFKTNSREEAKNLMSYLQTKFANFMLASRKISQDINSSVISWIPLVNLDQSWDNESIYEHFNLTSEEIQTIEKL